MMYCALLRLLEESLAHFDSAFRIGGDEFALPPPANRFPAGPGLVPSRRNGILPEMLQPLQLAVTVGMDHGVAIFPQDANKLNS